MKKLLLFMFLVSCGSEREIEVKKAPPSNPDPIPVGEGFSFAQGKPLVDEYCTPCHGADPFVKSSTGWLQSAAKTRLTNNSMPPPASSQAKKLSGVDRQKLISIQ